MLITDIETHALIKTTTVLLTIVNDIIVGYYNLHQVPYCHQFAQFNLLPHMLSH